MIFIMGDINNNVICSPESELDRLMKQGRGQTRDTCYGSVKNGSVAGQDPKEVTIPKYKTKKRA